MARRKHSGEGLGHSLTDLMTSIAVIFILLFLAFLQNEREEIAARKQETKSNREQLLAQLRERFPDKKGIKIKEDADDPLTLEIVLTDNPDLLSFESEQAKVKPTGVFFLEGFVPDLAEIVCSNEAQGMLDSIIVEGHTDSNGDDDLNTGLSARRATDVLIHSRKILAAAIDGHVAAADTLEHCFLTFAQATGRGEQDLVLREDETENKGASRRVIIKVRVKSLEQREAVDDVQEASVGG
jgi:flagellar motor protein MotB